MINTLVALFHAFTLNGDWSFQASKTKQKHLKSGQYDFFSSLFTLYEESDRRLSHYSLIIFFSNELSTWEPLWPHWILEITEKIWLRQTRHRSGTQEVRALLLLHYMICLSSLTAVIQLFKVKYSLRASCLKCSIWSLYILKKCL